MSQHRGNHVKRTRYENQAGEAPAADLRMTKAQTESLRQKHRSPFGFVNARRSKPIA